MKFKEYLNESVFTVDNINSWIEKLKQNIKAPYLQIETSTLGGIERPTIIITLSLDKKEEWKNNIFHNSRYMMLSLDYNGKLENFSGNMLKMRKSTVKTVDDAITKINEFISTVPST